MIQDSFYIPFWFQAVQGVDPIVSGVRFIPLFLAQMVALIVTGALVTRWGYYVSTHWTYRWATLGTDNYL